MVRKIVEVGDIFGIWEVIGLEENDKKYNYNYICKCDCGYTRMIRKDKLVNLNYPKCEKCFSHGLIKRKSGIIKSYWHKKNGKMPSLKDLDVNKQYYWECPEGHSFVSNIIMLSNCPICKNLETAEKQMEILKQNYNLLVDYIDDVTYEIFNSVEIKVEDEYFIIYVELENFIILLTPTIHKGYNVLVHNSKNKYFNIASTIKSLRSEAIKSPKEHIFLDVELNFKKDVRKILDIFKFVNSKN